MLEPVTHARIMLGRRVRAARALLGWSAADLAAAAMVGLASVKRMEAPAVASPSPDTFYAIMRAFEDAGIRFLWPDGGGWGIELRPPAPPADGADKPAEE
jgi:transcriptional regulator with XRE-family HTH domain